MVRNSITLVPLVGVFIALMSFAVGDLAMVEVQVPRRLDGTCCGCDRSRELNVQITLHADSSAELNVDGQRTYVDASRLAAALRLTLDTEIKQPEAIYLNPDPNASWEQVVETTSSLANVSGLEIALVTPPEPRYDLDW